MRMMAYTPTFVSRPAKIASTGPGALGYESGNHTWSGNRAAFMPNTRMSRMENPARISSDNCGMRCARSAMLTVPVAAYTSARAVMKNVEATRLITT